MSELVNRLREERKNPSVLKIKIIQIRSSRPDILIFVFEGVDDVGVYDTWIQRAHLSIKYEPLPGKGKQQVLGLRDLLAGHDGILRRIYFFIDADFDPLAEPSARTYVLQAYSTENFLVTAETLDSLLKDEFRCSGAPDERAQVLKLFLEVFSQFVKNTSELHFRMFCARRLNISMIERPERITDLIQVKLDHCRIRAECATTIHLEHEAAPDDVSKLREDFDNLAIPCCLRGKYVLQFFRAWLSALVADRKSETPTIFGSRGDVSGDPSNVPLRRLAQGSSLPNGLPAFLQIAASEP